MTAAAPASRTIGRLARAAGVGVETIRYYQQRGLLPVPASVGAFRHYPLQLTARIRFIKRSQELGFSLDEITGLRLDRAIPLSLFHCGRLSHGAIGETVRTAAAGAGQNTTGWVTTYRPT